MRRYLKLGAAGEVQTSVATGFGPPPLRRI